MPAEPQVKRAAAFVDGQNLFYAVKNAFGYAYPNYDVDCLCRRVVSAQGWTLSATHFYTGMPAASDNARWNRFWTRKLAVMGTRGIRTYARPLKYRNQTVSLPNGMATTVLVGQEKGIDLRIALDVVRLALEDELDVAVVFSQDQDLSELAAEVRRIGRQQNRWIKIASAFPSSPVYRNTRGINGTDWIRIDRPLYDACLDPNDYR